MELRGGLFASFGALVLVAVGGFSWRSDSRYRRARDWNPQSAARYLDGRLVSWTRGGAMDHGTFCISCHTGLPYALGRSAMRLELGEKQKSSAELTLLASVTNRVQSWDQVQPYLGDKGGGFGTESVLNALILANEDAAVGRLSETTKQALRIMWGRQRRTGADAGAWPWINAGNEPWEAPDSEYWGATLAAVAVGTAPDVYVSQPGTREGIRLLRAYLVREKSGSLSNQIGLLWASTRMRGLLSASEQAEIISEVLAKQQADGGWSTSSLILSSWKRHDGTPQDARSDGYATGLVAYVLGQTGYRRGAGPLRRALTWLTENQDRASGAWPVVSPNTRRDPSTDVGKFMTDAATAYAALALSQNE